MFGALHSSKHSNKTVEETFKNKTLNFLLVYVFAKVTCRAMKEDHKKLPTCGGDGHLYNTTSSQCSVEVTAKQSKLEGEHSVECKTSAANTARSLK